ncbi:MAG: exodeoxyribonuclease VII small subunit [Actinobacteria bacterium]|nr:exodeoxyribonuclease VII small subunit [Actinomycetota bacterium]
MASEVTLPEEMSFGAALAELEQIVRALEDGQLELEDGLARYERGVALLRACQEKLAQAKQKVTMLIGELEGDAQATEGDEEGAE